MRKEKYKNQEKRDSKRFLEQLEKKYKGKLNDNKIEEYKENFDGKIKEVPKIFTIILEILPNQDLIMEILLRRISSNEKLLNKVIKYLEEKCKLYFDKTISNWIDELNLTTEIKNKIRNLSDVDKARFAWYCVAFEIYFKITDSEKTKNFFKKSIIDAHFNDVFYGKPAKDFGVDAVHIEDNTIHLFNFLNDNVFLVAIEIADKGSL